MGKDIGFVTAFYKSDPVIVAPVPYTEDLSSTIEQYLADGACKEIDSDLRLPDKEELGSMFINKTLIPISVSSGFWSGSIISVGTDGNAWRVYFTDGLWGRYSKNISYYVRCVWK